MHTAREKFSLFNSMAGVVAGLENEYTTIDLRNEAIVTGKIDNVDAMMNVNMVDVTFYDAKGIMQTFESFYINARLIRHVHIPKNLSPEELFSRQQRKLQKVKAPKAKPTYKDVRAKRNNAETIRQAFK